MYVSGVRIQRFGLLDPQEFGPLSPGLTVFLGRNEAGKSTCLRFFQAVMFGFKRGRTHLDPCAVHNGTASGGTLLFHSRTLGALRLTRLAPGREGDLVLEDAAGARLPAATFQQLTGGMTVEVFDNIFAFSLARLMEFSSLQGEGVRHALHGAAFGTGLRAPAEVLRTLENRMGELFKPRGRTARMNSLARRLEEIAAALESRGPDLERYAAVMEEREALDRRLAEQEAGREEVRQLRRQAQRRLEAWPAWKELQEIEAELEDLAREDAAAPTPDQAVGRALPAFSQDAAQRMDALLAQREERSLAVEAERRTLERLARETAALPLAPELAARAGAVQALREQRLANNRDAEQLAVLEQSLARLRARQKDILERLGPEWDGARTLAAQTTLAVTDHINRTADRFAQQAARCAALCLDVQRLEGEQKQAADSLARARSACGPDAVPPDLPTEAETEFFVQQVVRAREACADLPRLREQAAARLRETHAALALVHPEWTVAHLEGCDLTAGARAEAGRLFTALDTAGAACERARDALAMARQEAVAAAGRQEASRREEEQWRTLPGRDELEERQALLQRLSKTARELTFARERHALAEQARARQPVPGTPLPRLRVRGPVFLGGGAVLGCGALATYLSQAPALWPALCLVALCAWMLLGAWSALQGRRTVGAAPDTLLHVLREQEESARAAMEEKLQAVRALCARVEGWTGPLPAPDLEEACDAALRLVARQLEQRLLADRTAQETARRAAEVRDAAQRAEQAQTAREVARQEHAQAEARLETFFRRLFGPEASLPAPYPGLLDRLDVARSRLASVQEAGRGCERAVEAVQACLEAARAHPFFAAALEQARVVRSFPEENTEEVAPYALDVLDKALEAARRERGRDRERRTAEAVVRERSEHAQRVDAALKETRTTLQTALEESAAQEQRWRDWLTEHGLAVSLTPEAAAEAVELAREYAQCAREAERLLGERDACGAALQQFADAVRRLAAVCGCGDAPGRESAPHASSLEGVAALLEKLSVACGRACEAAAQERRLQEQAREGQERMAAAEAALRAADKAVAALLQAAGVAEIRDFYPAFERWQQRDKLLARKRSLAVRLAALAEEEGCDLGEFEDDLRSRTEEALRDEKSARDAELAEVEAALQRLREQRGGLTERSAALAEDQGCAPLRQEAAMVREELQRLSRQWSVYALARQLLLEAKERLEKDGRQGVIGHAGTLFAAITDGAYQRIAASLDGERFVAVHADGSQRDPETQLSQGTREQLYLALRLAYIRNHACLAEPLPVIMDDILVNFDPDRARQTARVLAHFSREHQVLFFTCHPATARLLLEEGGRASLADRAPLLFSLRQGRIEPASPCFSQET